MSGWWVVLLSLFALVMTRCTAEQIHCDVSHPTVAAALDRLKVAAGR